MISVQSDQSVNQYLLLFIIERNNVVREMYYPHDYKVKWLQKGKYATIFIAVTSF